MTNLETKIDRLTLLIEDQEAKSRQSSYLITRELLLNTVLASTVGYFIFRILDHFFRKTKR